MNTSTRTSFVDLGQIATRENSRWGEGGSFRDIQATEAVAATFDPGPKVSPQGAQTSQRYVSHFPVWICIDAGKRSEVSKKQAVEFQQRVGLLQVIDISDPLCSRRPPRCIRRASGLPNGVFLRLTEAVVTHWNADPTAQIIVNRRAPTSVCLASLSRGPTATLSNLHFKIEHGQDRARRSAAVPRRG
ncbi:MAG: hypothetical protein ACOC1G_00825 [Phycisphaeraceae bacterium]